jgi:hypothetical protein
MRIPTDISCQPASWDLANREMLWGWKRDSGPKQRIILFGASLSVNLEQAVELQDWFFYYRSRSRPQEAQQILRLLRSDCVVRNIGQAVLRPCTRTGLEIVELTGGPGIVSHRALILRLLNRRPRKQIPSGRYPAPVESRLRFSEIGPIAAYVGSGLSYESGLPTLASVHEVFGVDHLGDSDFTFGARDPIPQQLADSVAETFAQFARFHLLAAVATPSPSHERFARLYRDGLLTRILTDNVDNLLSALGVAFTRTRGIGIFNDRFPLRFDRNEKTLLVVGVAADRRSIIQQARAQGLRIVVVNPEELVSPKSQSLSYLRAGDTWYRKTAADFFRYNVHD